MTKLTKKQTELLQHMLGADERYMKKQWGFRNHYVSTIGNSDHDELLTMENLGLVKSGTRLDNIVFWATKIGAVAIGFKLYQIRKTQLAS